MPFTAQITFLQIRQALARRLYDPNMVFWTDAELKTHIWNAMRFWNVLAGEWKKWFALELNSASGYGVGGYGLGGYGVGQPGIWYDLFQIANTPRTVFLNDTDVYGWMQYLLLEPQNPVFNPASPPTTLQFQIADFTQAVQRKRDEFLMRTGCTRIIETINVNPLTPTISLPEKVIQALRGYWLPIAGGVPFPLVRINEYAAQTFSPFSQQNPGNPQSFSAGTDPQLIVNLYPPPSIPGVIEFITIEAQGALGISGVGGVSPFPLFIPQDFAPALMWGAFADILGSGMEQQDESRAQYAQQRFEQFVQLMDSYPFVLAARNAGIPMQVDGVEALDIWNPNWRNLNANPTILATAGQNLIGCPTNADKFIDLFMLSNALLPVLDADIIQLGYEVIDVLVDMAFHESMFRCGGTEFLDTLPQFQSMIKLAAERNARVRALSTFRDVLYGRTLREDLIKARAVQLETS